ncbi:MAG: hypothetical protein C4584_01405 [Armatimonadetes bacterium]|nr:MAG: hypothetical protein C4584_01405 [Armatimonadota bacterium]
MVLSVFVVTASIVSADADEPVTVQVSEGWMLRVPFHTAGKGQLLYSKSGIQICGNFYPGEIIIGIVADEDRMSIEAKSPGPLYPDPIDVSIGPGYPSWITWAPGIAEKTREKAEAVENSRSSDLRVRRMAVVLIRDVAEGQVCKLVTSELPTAPFPGLVPQAPAPQPFVPQPLTPQVPQAPTGQCEPAVRSDFVSNFAGQQMMVIPADEKWRILNGWSNWVDPNLGDFKLLIPPGTGLIFKGGGSIWTRPAGCESATHAEFAENFLPPMTIEQLSSMGFIGSGQPIGFIQPSVPAQVAGCSPAQEATYTSPTDVVMTGPAIVQPWWNNGLPTFGQQQVRVQVDPGQTVTFVQMMGKVYSFDNTSACQTNLPSEFAKGSNLTPMTVGQLATQQFGLIRLN